VKTLIPIFFSCLSILIGSLFTSCFPAVESAAVVTEDAGLVTVSFTIASIEQIPFENTATTRSAALSSLCTRFSIALFQDGEKVKTLTQTADDATFGTLDVQLKPGSYQLVAIAHNGLGNCTISSPDKITFASNKLTDTFYYSGPLDVTESASVPLILSRPVAMFRYIMTDTIPAEVDQIEFYYTGGSSTFDATTGYGCVNSRQTESFTLSTLNPQPSAFEIYTFPHEDLDWLNIVVSAYDAAGNTLAEQTLTGVPVTPNVITQHTGSFFKAENRLLSLSTTVQVENDGLWADMYISEETAGDTTGEVDVTVTIPGFDITQSPEAGARTRTTGQSAAEAGIKSLTLQVFDSEGQAVATQTQASGDADFGTLSFRLRLGTYTFVAVAHTGTKAATITSATSATLEEYVNITTYSCVKNDVAITTDISTHTVNMDMGKRDNAIFTVKITDSFPDDVRLIQIIISPSPEATAPTSLIINPTTGFAAESWEFSRTVAKSKIVPSTGNNEVSLTAFLTSASQQVNITINALDIQGAVLYTRTLQNVTLQQAGKTTATGTLFSSGTSGTLQFDTTLDQNNISLD